jgi:hypothetical protein
MKDISRSFETVDVLISISSSRRELARAEIAIHGIAAETAQIFPTFSPALHLGRWNFDDQMTHGVRATRRPKERKSKLLKRRLLLRRKASKSLITLQEPPNTDASC